MLKIRCSGGQFSCYTEGPRFPARFVLIPSCIAVNQMRLTTVWWGVGKCLSKCRGRCLVWKNHCHSRRLYGALLLGINSCQRSNTSNLNVFHSCKAHIYGLLCADWPCCEQMHFGFYERQNFQGKMELSCLPMTAFDGSFIQGLRRKGVSGRH